MNEIKYQLQLWQPIVQKWYNAGQPVEDDGDAIVTALKWIHGNTIKWRIVKITTEIHHKGNT